MVAQSHENTRHTSYLRTQQRHPLRVMEPANLNRGDEPVMQLATQQRIRHNVTLLLDMLSYLEYRLPSYMVIKPKTSRPHLRERKEWLSIKVQPIISSQEAKFPSQVTEWQRSKDSSKCKMCYSGLLPNRLVDHCFQDILTGDPFFFSHQHKASLREGN